MSKISQLRNGFAFVATLTVTSLVFAGFNNFQSPETERAQASFFAAVGKKAMTCLMAQPLRSRCMDFVLYSPAHAQVLVSGQWYALVLTTSRDADAGDINDLVVYNSRGVVVAAKYNLPAFSNLYKAFSILAGKTKQIESVQH